MAFTYDPTNPTDITEVRLLIGDTNEAAGLFTDEEIQLLLDMRGSVNGAAAEAAKTLAYRYASEVDKWVGDLKILSSQMAERYQKLYEDLVSSGAALSTYAVPTAGGVYQGDKDSYEANEALAKPAIKRNIHDNRT